MKPKKFMMTLALLTIAVAIAVGVIVPTASASARPRRPPAPVPSPAPAAALVTDILINEANSGSFRVTNPSEFGVDYLVQIAGPPAVPTSPFPASGASGYVVANEGRLTGLSPSSTYTVTVFRQRFYDPVTNRAVNVLSAPTRFSFTTPSLEASRPSSPQIREVGRVVSPTGSSVDLAWAPSTDNGSASGVIRYTYSVAGDPDASGCADLFQLLRWNHRNSDLVASARLIDQCHGHRDRRCGLGLASEQRLDHRRLTNY